MVLNGDLSLYFIFDLLKCNIFDPDDYGLNVSPPKSRCRHCDSVKRWGPREVTIHEGFFLVSGIKIFTKEMQLLVCYPMPLAR